MSDKHMLSVLRHKDISPEDWKAEGPGGKRYTVVEHKREFIPQEMNCGKITFVIRPEGDDGGGDAVTETFIGFIGSVADDGQSMKADGTEAVTRNGDPLPKADIDGGVAALPVLSGFPPRVKLKGNVIVKFRYEDTTEEDDTAEYRFEGKAGQFRLG